MIKVYYDKKKNRFATIRKIKNNVVYVAWAEYYIDSQTTTSIYPVKFEYTLDNFELVTDIHKFVEEIEQEGFKIKR